MCRPAVAKAHDGQVSSSPLETIGLHILRWLPAVVIAAYLSGTVDLDTLIFVFWDKIGTMTFFKQPMAEAYVAAFSFLGWIILWSMVDAVPGLACFRMTGFHQDTKPMHSVIVGCGLMWATFLAIGEPFGRMFSAAILAVNLLTMYLTGSWAVLRAHEGMTFYTIRAYFQFMGYLAGILVFHCFKTPAASSWSSVTFGKLAVETAFGIFAYDFLFSLIHYGMHKIQHLSRAVDHHQHHELTSWSGGRLLAADTTNHGVLDFTLQVGVNIIVQNIPIFGTAKHKLARFLHNIIVTGLLVEAHASYDGFWSTHRLYPGFMGGAARHVEHHMKGKRFYQQFFCYLDDWVFH